MTNAIDTLLMRQNDDLRAEVAQLTQDRDDALSVRSKDGLPASEWVLRTGRAERERDEAKAETEKLKGQVIRCCCLCDRRDLDTPPPIDMPGNFNWLCTMHAKELLEDVEEDKT